MNSFKKCSLFSYSSLMCHQERRSGPGQPGPYDPGGGVGALKTSSPWPLPSASPFYWFNLTLYNDLKPPPAAADVSVPGRLEAEGRPLHRAQRSGQQHVAHPDRHQRQRHGRHGRQDARQGAADQHQAEVGGGKEGVTIYWKLMWRVCTIKTRKRNPTLILKSHLKC